MHIPENYLSPFNMCCNDSSHASGMGIFIHKVKTEIPKSKMPLLGIGAAFSFLGMMFNVPLPGGTTGHAVGGNSYCHTYRKSCSRVHIGFYCIC